MAAIAALMGASGPEAEVLIGALAAAGVDEVRLLLPPGAAPPQNAVLPVTVLPAPTTPTGLERLLAGAAIAVKDLPSLGELGLEVIVDAALQARVPLLGMSGDVATLRRLALRSDEARRLGVPIMLTGGLVPGLGAVLVSGLLDGGTRRVEVVSRRAGLGGLGFPCVYGLMRNPAALLSGGVWRDDPPLTAPRVVELASAGEVMSWRWGAAELVGIEARGVVDAEARLAFDPPALGWALWARARLTRPAEAPQRSPRLPPAPMRPGGLIVEATVEAPTRTQRAVLSCPRPEQALSAAGEALVAALLTWRVPMGIHTVAGLAPEPASALAEACEAAFTRRGLLWASRFDVAHRVEARAARRLHILAP